LKLIDLFHVFPGKFEVEYIQIFLLMDRISRFGNAGDIVLLSQPAEGDLGGGLTVFFPDFPELRIIYSPPFGQGGIGGDR